LIKVIFNNDMKHSRLVTQEALDAFVETDSRRAQEVLVELVYRLVCATDQNPREPFHFPLDVSQKGLDGYVNASTATPYFPEGKSHWQFGTSANVKRKCEADLAAIESRIPVGERVDQAAILVTIWSGAKKRKFLVDDRDQWIKTNRDQGKWGQLKVLDGTDLITWVSDYPVIDRWLATKLERHLPPGLRTIEEHWLPLERVGYPPSMKPLLFTVGREIAVVRVKQTIERPEALAELRIDTKDPDDVIDFVVAVMQSYDPARLEHLRGRCMIVEDGDSWRWAASSSKPHLLIATPKLALLDDWPHLLLTARQKGHAIIYSAMPGGQPSNTAVTLPSPTVREIETTLKVVGHPSELSRSLANRSGGNLLELKEWMINVSTMPSWGQGTVGADMVLAVIVGSFDAGKGSDRAALDEFLGKQSREWIRNLSAIATQPTSPLNQQNEVWRFTSRYRAWRVLAPRITNDDLIRLQKLADTVFQVHYPEFELPRDERHMAHLTGSSRIYSAALREGLAVSLALIGSEPALLTGCTVGQPVRVVSATVRKLLSRSDWKSWASLNQVLPLLAEASPEAFLQAVERDLSALTSSPFKTLYAEESTDILFGANHSTGLLWALETLAWSPDYLVRVTLILGRLDQIDPGGNWANRPGNSLTSIFLPWFPQTMASIEQRTAALANLTKESRATAWKVLLGLLPAGHGTTMGSRKPAWRHFIPAVFSDGASAKDYWDQVLNYSNLALSMARTDSGQLVELVSNFEKLHPVTRETALQFLNSGGFPSQSETERGQLWVSMSSLISKHRKYSKTDWALPEETVDRLSAISTSLRPSSDTLFQKRLFSHEAFDLIEENEDYRSTERKIEGMRQEAVAELYDKQGLEGVLAFIQEVPLPWNLGQSLGMIDREALDEVLLVKQLSDDSEVIRYSVAGYVWGRFQKQSWNWVDRIWPRITDGKSQIRLLMLLPFQATTWFRLNQLSEEQQAQYWKEVNASPYGNPTDMIVAASKLLAHQRPRAASQCLWQTLDKTQDVPLELIYRAVKESAGSEEGMSHCGHHSLEKLITWLQKNPAVDKAVMLGIEWQYIKLLDQHRNLAPITIEHRMANDPKFFMELIRLLYRSENDAPPDTLPDEQRKRAAENTISLFYNWRTPPGSLPDGRFSAKDLSTWMGIVRELAGASGHLKAAMTEIGEVFARDPNRWWAYEEAIGEILNAPDADSMRDGFRTQLYNNRGAYGYSAGHAEFKIAKDYKDSADKLELKGYHLLAQTLRELASSYESDAEREAAANPYR